jgi:lysophospholipase L1-like esterase
VRFFRSRNVVALAILLLLPGDPAWAGAARTDPRYVALGDSYSAGVGSGGRESGGNCLRNTNAFPARWAKAHPGYDTVLNACSGAGVEAVRQNQLAALTSDTSLVTLTVGGNDIGFAHAMTICVIDPRDAPCLAAAEQGAKQSRTVLPDRLRALYAQIRGRAPRAEVLVLGYPRFFSDGRIGCRLLRTAERSAINDTIDTLNRVIDQQATAAGFRFVDVRPLFAGHGLCTATPWLNAVTFPLVRSFHPNDAGQRDGYLPALNAATR